MASLLVPTTLALGGCRISYELLDGADGSLGGAGPGPTDGDGSGAATGVGAAGSGAAGSADGGTNATGGNDSSTGGAGTTGGADSGGTTSAGGASSGGATSSGGTGSGGASSGGATSSGGSSGGGSSGSGGAPPVDYPVTTTVDEDDPDATVGSPGQSGLSLREAISLANDTPGTQTIGLEPGAALPMGSVLPIITEGLVLVGAGASLDFSGVATASSCVHSDASNVSIQDVEISGCSGEPIFLGDAAATGLEVLRCDLHDNGQPAMIYGTGTLIQGNVISTSGAAGLAVYGSAAEVRDNQLFDNDTSGIFLASSADGAVLVGNLVVRGDVGISFGTLAGATLWFNTVEGAGGFGISIGAATSIDFRNNIVTGSGTTGLNAADARFSVITHNLFFQNTSGDCNNCTPGAPYLTSDPLYVNPAADDFSVQTTSPAVNAGLDVGEDRNGSGAGICDGPAPDLGFVEVN